jgi:glycosyltransferase involved in cell wall biosynthesis
VLASVVIPVRDRERTIADAVRSALSQRTSFPYNVIVVDNHSTDRTTEILRRWASTSPQLIHKIPERRDLGIGGCWNEAIFAPECGMLAVQLDSDDLYANEGVLETIVQAFFDPEVFARAEWARPSREWPRPRYAMVIGAYRTVNFRLEEIPPGVVDHREWTCENGRNNALRVKGCGAPRAYYVPLLRRFGFPNVSYGEDYAMCLRLSREYEIGRLWDPIYMARRWEGNTDRALPWEVKMRYEAYKDWVRTLEIRARQQRNRRREGGDDPD